jgi:hypothetical protein
MLVNDAQDLQDINLFLHGNYALSKNIEASETKFWNNGKGFAPLFNINMQNEVIPFSGDFDGNSFQINNLNINRGDEDNVGIFGMIAGAKIHNVTISNLKLNNLNITGHSYVGFISGEAEYAKFINIEIKDSCNIHGKAIVGGIVGSASGVDVESISFSNISVYKTMSNEDHFGLYFGAVRDSIIHDDKGFCNYLELNNDTLDCFGYSTNLDWQE